MDDDMKKSKEHVDEMRAIGDIWKDYPYTLHRSEIYTCGNCGFEAPWIEPFKKGVKYETDHGGCVPTETHAIPRLICPKCGEELDYHG